ncbi:MAG: type II toxin-antitoxin system RatA family toxin [Pseudomonadales bacterium]|nr:type II toxin-antitoxin system RatA family toxin [Pseudomonadales bacterium]
MQHIERSALMPYSAEQMFSVIDDVEAYPEFLPWCASAELLSYSETELIGRLTLSRGNVKQTFTTRNRMNRPHTMTIELVEGPFKTLSGRWTLTQLGEDGCKVHLTLGFEFDSRIMNFTFGKVFGAAADRLVDAFCERARQLYG